MTKPFSLSEFVKLDANGNQVPMSTSPGPSPMSAAEFIRLDANGNQVTAAQSIGPTMDAYINGARN